MAAVQRHHAEVDGHALAPLGQGLTLQADHHRIEPAPLRAVEVGELPVGGGLRRGDAHDGNVGDRRHRPAPAAKLIVDLALVEHGAAAVGTRAEIGRQQAPGDKLLDGPARLPFGRRRQNGQLHQLDVGVRLQAAGHLHAVSRAGERRGRRRRKNRRRPCRFAPRA